MEANGLIHLLRLNGTCRLGWRQAETLSTRFGSLAEVFRRSTADLAGIPGIGPRTAELILDPAGEEEAKREIERTWQAGFQLLVYSDKAYPERLRSIHNPPLLLYVRGSVAALSEPLALAVVGSRRATAYGKLTASKLARELAELGFLVVSGLARGIDGAAHAGAIAAKGKTVAFLGSGLDRIYPPEHKRLAEEIAARSGAVVSEFPLGTRPLGHHFPRRNRLVSGLSLGVLAVEATERSGALSTVGHAVEQGREVYAVPGRIDSATSRGTHRLIRDGAKLVETIEDILEELSPEARRLLRERAPPPPSDTPLSPEEASLLELLSEGARHVEELTVESGLPAAAVTAALTGLEIKHRARRLPGMAFERIS